jgi:glutamate carboxypeptidase
MRLRACLLIAASVAACRPAATATTTAPLPAAAEPANLSSDEARIRDAVRAHYDSAVDLLRKSVNIPSGTGNLAGVKLVGDLFSAELAELGFETRWVGMPESMRRAGHLVAVHRGSSGPRMLLIGHLDTVYEGAGQEWVKEDTVARGAGTSDMKGGDVAIILALRALKDAGRLDNMHVTVIMTGDEESAGSPLSIAREALINAAKESDIALAFEGGSAERAAIGRRGSSGWELEVKARQAHSSGVFSQGVGFGAAYEGARILDEFRRTLVGERGLTFNVGVMGAGTTLTVDTSGTMSVAGKSNIVPPIFRATGDLRFLTDAQKDSARVRMRAIVARSLNGAEATITFADRYPAMEVTDAGRRLLQIYDGASRSLGYPSVGTSAPESRGAGDISFIAPIIPGIDGLGVDGSGAHSPRELVYLPSLKMSAERAAIFMSRLVDSWPRSGATPATGQ